MPISTGSPWTTIADRRNGYYRRHLLTELGDIELAVPRTRRYSPTGVLRAYRRRTGEIDRVILAGFVLGLSTRKVGETLLALLGRKVSAETVSRVAKTLDAAVAAFHRRPLKDAYKVLMLDGVVLARKTGAGALRRPVLVALGLRPDGKKEIIDFRLAASESAAEWERVPRRSHPPRPHRRAPRDALRRWRPRPPGGPAHRLSRRAGPALLGAQDQECPRQGQKGRPAGRQAPPPRDHERPQPTGRQAAARRFADRFGHSIPPPSPACATTSTSSSPASATRPSISERPSAPPTPSSAASARSDDAPDPWAPSRTEPPWIASSSPSSPTKTNHRASAPLSC